MAKKIKPCNDFFQEVSFEFSNTAIDSTVRKKGPIFGLFWPLETIISLCFFIEKSENWDFCRFIRLNEILSFLGFVSKFMYRIVRISAISCKFTVILGKQRILIDPKFQNNPKLSKKMRFSWCYLKKYWLNKKRIYYAMNLIENM